MKKLSIIFGVLMLFNNTVKAQNNRNDSISNKANHFAIGYNLNDFGHDFGIGINLTSPRFAKKKMAIKISENYQWLNHIDNSGKYTWTGYHNIRIGVVSGGFIVNKSIRLYGEAGMVVLINPISLTTTSVNEGGYGLFGFEFFMTKGFSYFIEMGGIGVGAIAEQVPSSPIYSNGFLSSVGFRIYL